MSNAWGASFGVAWGVSWGASTAVAFDYGGIRPLTEKERKRQARRFDKERRDKAAHRDKIREAFERIIEGKTDDIPPDMQDGEVAVPMHYTESLSAVMLARALPQIAATYDDDDDDEGLLLLL